MQCSSTGLRSAMKKKRLLNGNGDVLYTVLMMQVLQPWQLRRPFIVFFLKDCRSLMKSV